MLGASDRVGPYAALRPLRDDRFVRRRESVAFSVTMDARPVRDIVVLSFLITQAHAQFVLVRTIDPTCFPSMTGFQVVPGRGTITTVCLNRPESTLSSRIDIVLVKGRSKVFAQA